MELTVDQKSISGNIYTVTEKTQQTYIWSNCTGQILYQPAMKLLAKGSRPEAAFLVRQNVTLPVWGLNFQPNKTGFIPRSDLTKKAPPGSGQALLVVPAFSDLQIFELCYWSLTLLCYRFPGIPFDHCCYVLQSPEHCYWPPTILCYKVLGIGFGHCCSVF